jgi:hypothetical protein
MANILDLIPFVKDQAAFHLKMAERFGPKSEHPNPKRSERHATSGATFALLAQKMEALSSEKIEPSKPSKPKPLSLSFEEIDGLPPELLQELSISDGDRTDYAIVRVIEECGGVASLDRILYGLYKETGEVLKRVTLTSRLYRMIQKGLVFPFPKKKGVYSTAEVSEAEADSLIS